MAEARGTPVVGALKNYAGRFDPPPGSGWLLADGRQLARVGTYQPLFAVLAPPIGTFTASGATLTLAGHGLVVGDSVYFITTGTLPTGLSANTLYYVASVTASTFTVSATITAAGPGAAITTTSAGTGTHTAVFCPYGLGDGATTFNIPDYRGRASLTPAAGTGRLPNSVSALGRFESGEERHVLTAGESGSAQHSHGNTPTNGVTGTGSTGTGITGTANVGVVADGSVHSHGGNFSSGAQSIGHTHQIPVLAVNATTDGASGNTTHTNAGGNSNYLSQFNAGSHAHGFGASINSQDTTHAHSYSVAAQAIPGQTIPGQGIAAQAAAPAASDHNNLPPGLAMNKIIRVS